MQIKREWIRLFGLLKKYYQNFNQSKKKDSIILTNDGIPKKTSHILTKVKCLYLEHRTASYLRLVGIIPARAPLLPTKVGISGQ